MSTHIRPSRLTLLLALPFALTVLVHGIDRWFEARRGEGDLLGRAAIRFEPRDRLLRMARLEPGVSHDGAALGSGWGERSGGGRRIAADSAEVLVRLPERSARWLLVEARRVGRGRAADRLELQAGGWSLGAVSLEQKWRVQRVEVPGQALPRGLNTLKLMSTAAAPVEVRALGFASRADMDLEDLAEPSRLQLKAREGWVGVSHPGRLVIELPAAPVPGRIRVKTRFGTADGRTPQGTARLVLSVFTGSGSTSVLSEQRVDASRAMWSRFTLEAPTTEPTRLVVNVGDLGPTESFRIETLWWLGG